MRHEIAERVADAKRADEDGEPKMLFQMLDLIHEKFASVDRHYDSTKNMSSAMLWGSLQEKTECFSCAIEMLRNHVGLQRSRNRGTATKLETQTTMEENEMENHEASHDHEKDHEMPFEPEFATHYESNQKTFTLASRNHRGMVNAREAKAKKKKRGKP